MRILVDAMGGDNAPDQIALGAIQAAKDFGCEVVLVGRGEAILRALKDQGIETLPKGVEIANADDVVDMHDDPATVVKKKKDSSMVVGLNMLKEGGGDAFVSAGSTGALLSAATLTVRRVKGIRRAAMAPQIPTKTGREAVLIDCGATADCTPEFLLQFAFMGSYYAEKVLGIENPRVALLNIGAEDSKGGELQKAVYPLLKQAGETGAINFTGNIEARDVPLGGADVVVADGFSGNILLKGIEGTALFHGLHDEGYVQEKRTDQAGGAFVHGRREGVQEKDGLPRDGRHGPHRPEQARDQGARLVRRAGHPQRHPAGIHRRRRRDVAGGH